METNFTSEKAWAYLYKEILEYHDLGSDFLRYWDSKTLEESRDIHSVLLLLLKQIFSKRAGVDAEYVTQ